MPLLDPDIWEKLECEIEVQVTSCCNTLYDLGQHYAAYPATEAGPYSRLIIEAVKQALNEQLRRDCGPYEAGTKWNCMSAS